MSSNHHKNRIRYAVIIHLFSSFTAKKLASYQVFVIDDSVKVAVVMWDMKKVKAIIQTMNSVLRDLQLTKWRKESQFSSGGVLIYKDDEGLIVMKITLTIQLCIFPSSQSSYH